MLHFQITNYAESQLHGVFLLVLTEVGRHYSGRHYSRNPHPGEQAEFEKGRDTNQKKEYNLYLKTY